MSLGGCRKQYQANERKPVGRGPNTTGEGEILKHRNSPFYTIFIQWFNVACYVSRTPVFGKFLVASILINPSSGTRAQTF